MLPPPPDFVVRPRTLNPTPAVDWSGFRPNRHLPLELATHFPRAAPGDTMLDLACGDGTFRTVAGFTGHHYVGLDIGGPVDLHGDAHSLPFPDDTFAFVMSLAALEHFRFPHVALGEVFRVLRPGGTFAGTVAFLQPFHGRSYYHHTHLGVFDGLQLAGFTGIDIAAVGQSVAPWSLRNALFPGVPPIVQRALGQVLAAIPRAWYRLGRVTRRPGVQNLHPNLSGTFDWVCTKPA